ncbi:hypothetical protein QR680_013085 [Steinernema hermaphroditum]|uniref:Uncharacterized protein n=1 Tax=Steinernema hermaphroditum TaxID=289476 RepID=A0AA39I6D2_9BILA|nr:hypothetical protein QR680_013085 [Steinernema hermaphroditum]
MVIFDFQDIRNVFSSRAGATFCEWVNAYQRPVEAHHRKQLASKRSTVFAIVPVASQFICWIPSAKITFCFYYSAHSN